MSESNYLEMYEKEGESDGYIVLKNKYLCDDSLSDELFKKYPLYLSNVRYIFINKDEAIIHFDSSSKIIFKFELCEYIRYEGKQLEYSVHASLAQRLYDELFKSES